MKRHPVLQPFSRDHYSGLVAATHLKEHPGHDMISALIRLWEDEMQDHFLEEERLLAPLAPADMAHRMFEDHEEIRSWINKARTGDMQDAEMVQLGTLIHNHIRWEERVMFPEIERNARISDIEAESEAMELRRQGDGNHPRRAELVNRRKKDS